MSTVIILGSLDCKLQTSLLIRILQRLQSCKCSFQRGREICGQFVLGGLVLAVLFCIGQSRPIFKDLAHIVLNQSNVGHPFSQVDVKINNFRHIFGHSNFFYQTLGRMFLLRQFIKVLISIGTIQHSLVVQLLAVVVRFLAVDQDCFAILAVYTPVSFLLAVGIYFNAMINLKSTIICTIGNCVAQETYWHSKL